MQNQQNQQAPSAQAGAQPPAAGAPPAGAAGQPPAAAPKTKTARVKFLATWSSDRGYFAPGDVAELPTSIAESLIKEKIAEASSEKITEK